MAFTLDGASLGLDIGLSWR